MSVHILEVTRFDDGETDAHVRHPSSCPTETDALGPFPIVHYTCPVGIHVASVGLDDLDVTEFVDRDAIVTVESGRHPTITGLEAWRLLTPGLYELEFWSQHYPSTPMAGEEWDEGLRLVARLDGNVRARLEANRCMSPSPPTEGAPR